MEPYSSVDHASPETGAEQVGAGVGAKSAEFDSEQTVQQNSSTRTSQGSVSAALAAAHAEVVASRVRFPGEDGGRSLAEMAQRDLDAALHLLADRAQYITGASGVAIALRRDGKNDMLCRASTGSNAPELGALLSTEFGLSGESVRTRQALRCDDAERDARVNREVCRQLGIASVVVMPVVNDDGVVGVFELFSGKVNAFGARDLSALQRLSEMVETAVRLAQAAESLPERLRMGGDSAAALEAGEAREEQVLDAQFLDDGVLEVQETGDQVLEDSILEEPEPLGKVAAEPHAKNAGVTTSRPEGLTEKESPIATQATPSQPETDSSADGDAAAPPPAKELVAENAVAAQALKADAGLAAEAATAKSSQPSADGIVAAARPAVPAASPETVAPKKPLYWSAALSSSADTGKLEEADQSHVPPMLRSLRKCEACGFPVSAGRVLCVECEEKKWRGQLSVPRAGTARLAVPTSRAAAPAPKPEPRAFAAASQPVAVSTPIPAAQRVPLTDAASSGAAAGKKSTEVAVPAVVEAPASNAPVREAAAEPGAQAATPSPDFVLSAGLAPSQSWLAANKYMIGVLLVVAGVVAAVFFLR